MTIDEVKQLPCVDSSRLCQASEDGGVYIIVCESRVAYVGVSVKIKYRSYSHRKTMNRKPFTLYWIIEPDEDQRLALEVQLIEELRPYINRSRGCLNSLVRLSWRDTKKAAKP